MCGLKLVLSSREDGGCVAMLKGGRCLSFKAVTLMVLWSVVPALAVSLSKPRSLLGPRRQFTVFNHAYNNEATRCPSSDDKSQTWQVTMIN